MSLLRKPVLPIFNWNVWNIWFREFELISLSQKNNHRTVTRCLLTHYLARWCWCRFITKAISVWNFVASTLKLHLKTAGHLTVKLLTTFTEWIKPAGVWKSHFLKHWLDLWPALLLPPPHSPSLVPPASTQPIRLAVTTRLMTHTSCYSNIGLPPGEHVMHVKWLSDAHSSSLCLALSLK